MRTIVRLRIAQWGIVHVLLVIVLLSLPLLAADNPKDPVPAAPIPSSIAGARKVFISNAPGDNLPAFFGRSEHTYNEFYAAMKGWGR